jgi:integrase/recombinase XerD
MAAVVRPGEPAHVVVTFGHGPPLCSGCRPRYRYRDVLGDNDRESAPEAARHAADRCCAATRRTVAFLDHSEMEALLAAPDSSTVVGRRDHAILIVALQTGLRASELVNLRCGDIVSGTGAHIRCKGKGRKQRCTPLRRETVKMLEVWLRERVGADGDPLFITNRRTRLSRDALEHIVRTHTLAASRMCPSLIGKRVSPHVLRHSTAMELLHHGVDQSVIALWLGHEAIETTQVYIHADLRLKEKALARVAAPASQPTRYRPDAQLLAFLESL